MTFAICPVCPPRTLHLGLLSSRLCPGTGKSWGKTCRLCLAADEGGDCQCQGLEVEQKCC